METSGRTWANYLNAAAGFIPYYKRILWVSGLMLGGIMLVTVSLLRRAFIDAEMMGESGLPADLRRSLTMIAVLYFSTIIFFTMGFMAYMIVVAQRIGGPMKAICKFIDELRRGNYEYRRNLRPNDELGPIIEQLNDLARHLKERCH
jgi:hypothetical protein